MNLRCKLTVKPSVAAIYTWLRAYAHQTTPSRCDTSECGLEEGWSRGGEGGNVRMGYVRACYSVLAKKEGRGVDEFNLA